jgi:hypothetical protein
LKADIVAFIETHNENSTPYKRVKSADQIRATVKRGGSEKMDSFISGFSA